MDDYGNHDNSLHERLVRLERQVADLYAALKHECLSTTEHIEAIYEFLGPLLRKVFPDIETDQSDVRKFLAGLRGSKGDRA